MENKHTILDDLDNLILYLKKQETEKISIQEIISKIGESAIYLILLIFTIPVALPLPALGIASILGLVMFFLLIQIFIGKKKPYLPKFILKKEISKKNCLKIANAAEKFISKIKPLFKKRLSYFCTKNFFKITCILLIIFTISVILPIPFSNTIPSIGIVFVIIGTLLSDGLMTLAGLAIGIAGTAYSFTALAGILWALT